VETPGLIKGATRGVRILFDPVFAERTSPFTWIGPKRYTPPPCTAEDLPDVDVICISHSHYDHLDIKTVKQLYAKLKGRVVFVVPLKLKKWFLKNIRCQDDDVVELDWWESCRVSTEDYGSIDIVGCPAQHGSGRTIWDTGRTLWCGFSIECRNLDDPERDRRLYYAGDTAYQAVSAPSPCPAFKEIGSTLGPFDLAFIPIGLYSPPSFMSAVHVTPEQALSIHKDVQAKRSLGMHYGTVRGGISKAFEDVRDPPRRWREIAEKEGLWLGGGVEGEGSSADWTGNGVGLCDIGETVAV
jgi:L-ascorbate metabolism protein UlaG (beta-lactamase superfamily)